MAGILDDGAWQEPGREARRHIYKQIAEGGRPGLEEEKREAGVGAAADGYS